MYYISALAQIAMLLYSFIMGMPAGKKAEKDLKKSKK